MESVLNDKDIKEENDKEASLMEEKQTTSSNFLLVRFIHISVTGAGEDMQNTTKNPSF